MVAAETQAAFRGLVSMTLACKQSTQPVCAKQPTSSLVVRRGSLEPTTRGMHALQENGGLADLWYTDDGDILRHPILVPSCLQEFGVANAKVGAERKPQKTEVIHHVNDLDAAPPEWRNGDVRDMAQVPTATSGSITLGVAVGPRQFMAEQIIAKADVIRVMNERVQLCQDPQTEFALLRESLGISRTNHILRVHSQPHHPARATSR